MTAPYSFTRRTDGVEQTIYAEHINELQQAFEDHPMVPRLVSGYRYSTAAMWGGLGTAALAADTLAMLPIWVPTAGMTVASVEVRVSSAVAGSLRIGIYDCDQSTGLASDLLDDWGTVSVSTTGVKTIDITDTPYSRTGDTYPFLWVACVSDVAASYYVLAERGSSPMLGGNSSYVPCSSISRAFTYATLPDPAGAVTQAWTSVPNVNLVIA